jgi:hypothetical protein
MLLFDGKTTQGWRGYQMQAMPPGWQVIDGALVRTKGRAGSKGAGETWHKATGLLRSLLPAAR